MRTKTLLMTAAALAAGVIYSQAQGTVYSQNVVGYINQTIPAKGYAEFANQLINGSDVNQSNNNANAVLSSGMISDPNGPLGINGNGTPPGSNTVLLVFNGAAYASYYYFNAADASTYAGYSNAGWYEQNGSPATLTLAQGTSAFLENSFSAPMTATITGTVLQGTNSLLTVPTGYSLLALGTPVSTNVDAVGIGLPDKLLDSDPNGPLGINGNGVPPGTNDTYYFWNGSAYASYYYFNAADASTYAGYSNAGFYAQNGSPAPSTAYPAVGQGFIFFHTGGSFVYTNTFEVQ